MKQRASQFKKECEADNATEWWSVRQADPMSQWCQVRQDRRISAIRTQMALSYNAWLHVLLRVWRSATRLCRLVTQSTAHIVSATRQRQAWSAASACYFAASYRVVAYCVASLLLSLLCLTAYVVSAALSGSL